MQSVTHLRPVVCWEVCPLSECPLSISEVSLYNLCMHAYSSKPIIVAMYNYYNRLDFCIYGWHLAIAS